MSDTPQRSCGDCTACCQGWLRAKIFDTDMYPGRACPHITDQGCNCYDERPEVCRNFRCLWLINPEAFPDWMRPDRSKAIANGIIDPNSGVHAIKVVPAGSKLPTRTVNHLKQLSTNHKIPLLMYVRIKENGKFSDKVSVEAYGPPGMQHVFDYIRQQLRQFEYMGPTE